MRRSGWRSCRRSRRRCAASGAASGQRPTAPERSCRTCGGPWSAEVFGLSALRRRLGSSIGAQVLAGFGLSVAVALLVALVSLSAARDTTARLEALQEAQRRMVAALKDLELSTELQSS